MKVFLVEYENDMAQPAPYVNLFWVGHGQRVVTLKETAFSGEFNHYVMINADAADTKIIVIAALVFYVFKPIVDFTSQLKFYAL